MWERHHRPNQYQPKYKNKTILYRCKINKYNMKKRRCLNRRKKKKKRLRHFIVSNVVKSSLQSLIWIDTKRALISTNRRSTWYMIRREEIPMQNMQGAVLPQLKTQGALSKETYKWWLSKVQY